MIKTMILIGGLLALAVPAAAQDASVAALDQMVKGKPAVERQVPVTVDLVGYELDRYPQVKTMLQAAAQAGGGSFSTAGIKDIGSVMKGMVTGNKPAQPATQSGGRLSYGETIVLHGSLQD